MTKQPEEKISRRLGRVELLGNDLDQLPDGYQPTEREVEQFTALAAKIAGVFKLRKEGNLELKAAQKEVAELKAQVSSLEADLAQVKQEIEAPAKKNKKD